MANALRGAVEEAAGGFGRLDRAGARMCASPGEAMAVAAAPGQPKVCELE
eukprot:CAMPEP_0185299400 /NCGR_PEP_ID=MMETSP1363-20130426/11250_1 /TAXON_ID=38817 /ORGANISM="Gephyrocapsa oceanica, Strain RCC1303" /LENGTH=49 /DNA_ID= /DNA_START= /DNA_END= /DNA_ORIENTATION=